MTSIQLTAIQQPAGRQHDHVRAFGYRVTDVKKRVVEVAITADEALDYIREVKGLTAGPVILVDDWAWAHCLSPGDVDLVVLGTP